MVCYSSCTDSLSSMSSQQILWRACDVQLGTPLLGREDQELQHHVTGKYTQQHIFGQDKLFHLTGYVFWGCFKPKNIEMSQLKQMPDELDNSIYEVDYDFRDTNLLYGLRIEWGVLSWMYLQLFGVWCVISAYLYICIISAQLAEEGLSTLDTCWRGSQLIRPIAVDVQLWCNNGYGTQPDTEQSKANNFL